MKPEDQKQFLPQTIILRNGTQVVIRLLAESDGEALAQFYAEVPAEDAFFYQPHPLTRENALKNVTQASSPTEVVLVLETASGGIGGYAWYRWSTGAQSSWFGICVARAFQGTGAGRQLMTRLNETSTSVGPSLMTLTVQKRNPKAVQLYKDMGFQVVREQIRGDGEPEYAMERRTRS